jgi:hypothetical protein
MQKVRGHPEGLPLFVGTRFQGLFHFPFGELFTFPSRYLFTIGRQVVLSLGGWSPQIPAGFHVPHGTQVRDQKRPLRFAYGGCTLYAAASNRLPLRSDLLTLRRPCRSTRSRPTTPTQQRLQACTGSVWALPRSLATTWGVSFDFLSCGYLDVSVPRVGSAVAVTPHYQGRVSPFGHLRIIACLPASRSLSQAPTPFFAS